MNDEESIEYLEQKMAEPSQFAIVRNGKVRILGFALRRMQQVGKAPIYYIGFSRNGVEADIYDFAWSIEEILERARFVEKKKHCDPKQVGFNKINGQSLFDACENGGLFRKQILPQHFYEAKYFGP